MSVCIVVMYFIFQRKALYAFGHVLQQVLCVSAHEALLARLSARGLLDDDQRSQLHERTYPVSDPEDIPAEMYKTAAAKLFLGSGMPELEQVFSSVACFSCTRCSGLQLAINIVYTYRRAD